MEEDAADRRGQEDRASLGRTILSIREVELGGLLFVGFKGKVIGAPMECLSP